MLLGKNVRPRHTVGHRGGETWAYLPVSFQPECPVSQPRAAERETVAFQCPSINQIVNRTKQILQGNMDRAHMKTIA